MKLSCSLDWNAIETELRSFSTANPLFVRDYDRMIQTIAVKVSQLSQLELKSRRTMSSFPQAQIKEKVQEINDLLEHIDQLHYLNLLYKQF